MIPILILAGGIWYATGDWRRIAAGRTAVGIVLANHSDVLGAMDHPTLGPIDFRWGNAKEGFCHVITRAAGRLARFPEGPTGETILRLVPEVIVKGKWHSEGPRKVVVEHDGIRVTLAKDFHGKPCAHWVLSAYDVDHKKNGNR